MKKSKRKRISGKSNKVHYPKSAHVLVRSTKNSHVFIMIYIGLDAPLDRIYDGTCKLFEKKAKRENPIFNLTVIIRSVQLVFDMPTKLVKKIDKVTDMHKGLINPDYTPLFTPACTNPTPTVFKGYIDDFVDAYDAVRDKTGNIETRDAKWSTLYIKGVKAIIDYAEGLCRLHPDLAPQIAAALGLRLKNYTHPDTDDFAAKLIRSGVVELTGKVKGEECLFQWQASMDLTNPLGWYEVDIPPTFEGKTEATFTKEGKWYFRMRKIYRKNNVGEWLPTISCMVKIN